MVLLGLVLLKVMPVSLFSLPSPGPESFWRKIFPPLFQSRRLISKFALGLATGFLPCMLSWAMVVKAATTQHPLPGFLTMVFFGLGTVPALFLTGLSASLLSMRTRFLGERVAAASIIAMGLILIIKGAKTAELSDFTSFRPAKPRGGPPNAPLRAVIEDQASPET
jgi:sulfite exporter TauE/SafE